MGIAAVSLLLSQQHFDGMRRDLLSLDFSLTLASPVVKDPIRSTYWTSYEDLDFIPLRCSGRPFLKHMTFFGGNKKYMSADIFGF